ncbi:MAG TPA: PQQ-binding-like beta-propeller repeat protein, partial [Gemmatimonadaceae bacterium]|nr:PQQ-binding-like beta-propeller repeat protein [Gemmatimonadaceae bacterium]
MRLLWSVSQSATSRSRAAVTPSGIVFAGGDGTLTARNPANGEVVWTRTVMLPGEIQGSQLVVAGDALVAIGLRRAMGVSALDGHALWIYEPPVDSTDGNPGFMQAVHAVAYGNILYLPAWGASVSALDVTTGTVKW